jgi:hypothetical protein
MCSENEPSTGKPRPPADQRGEDAEDLVFAALDFLRGLSQTGGGSSGPPTLASQKEKLRQWLADLGLILNTKEIESRLIRGGQEHDFFREGERVFKVTRNGVFGLSPGIELSLVSSSEDPRRFHLWEASPMEYLERLHLQNLLVPGLNTLEGLIVQADGDMAIVTSQPRFDIVPVSTQEIDEWFSSLGFLKITDAAYYRVADNLGVFDAHDKNLVRADEVLVPFDVIPCHPSGGFLEFIDEAIAGGHRLIAVRTVATRAE